MKKKKKNTRYTQEERLAIIDGYDVSGMSLHDFCEKIGVNKRTVSNWLKNRRHQSGIFAVESEQDRSFVSLPINTAQEAGLQLQEGRSVPAITL